MQQAEIELKFCVGDAREFHTRALGAGFQVHTERTLERNTRCDTPERRLLSERQILRLREYHGRNLLTHKKPPAQNDDASFYKVRVETETDVTEPDALATVFSELGYGPVFRYEKFRTEFTDGTGELLLDETPIGIFAELEGTPEWIDASLERLGVARDLCFTDSYGRMFLDWRERSGSSAENMTFAEIEPAHVLA